MSEPLLLSILTPAVPSRLGALDALCSELAAQIGELPVEHLVLLDNKRRTVGEKRDSLLRIARGDFVAFVDDDDKVSGDYVQALLDAIQSAKRPDVITFNQSVSYNGQKGVVEFFLGHPNEKFAGGKITKRNAWHVCPWRRSLAILSHFPATNYGEDLAFAEKLWTLKGLRHVHVPKILHFYVHSAETTEAPEPELTSV